MKTLGIIGGIGPISTIKYYKQIIEEFKNSRFDEYYPHILIESLNMEEVIEQIDYENFTQVEKILLKSIRNLESAGAEIIVIASSTCHIVIDDLIKKSPLPIINILDCVYDKVVRNNYRKVLLIGNSFTLTHNIYQERLGRYKIKSIIPDSMDIQEIQEIIYPNLENGIILPDKKEKILKIIKKTIKEERDIDCLIITSTELSLIIDEEEIPIPVIDSANVHINKIVNEILKK